MYSSGAETVTVGCMIIRTLFLRWVDVDETDASTGGDPLSSVRSAGSDGWCSPSGGGCLAFSEEGKGGKGGDEAAWGVSDSVPSSASTKSSTQLSYSLSLMMLVRLDAGISLSRFGRGRTPDGIVVGGGGRGIGEMISGGRVLVGFVGVPEDDGVDELAEPWIAGAGEGEGERLEFLSADLRGLGGSPFAVVV